MPSFLKTIRSTPKIRPSTKEIEPEIINIFSYTKNNDLNFDFDPNLFINLDNNHNLYYENDKDKVFKEENLFFPQI